MPESWLKSTSRGMLRWYLNKFPLRDGKARLYGLLHKQLTPDERYVTVELDKGFKMKLDLRDLEQLKIYFYGHYHERYEAKLVKSLLDDDEVFWDIGANIGYFTLLAATALKGRGQIVSFEPGKVAFERLADNISLNSFNNIQIYNLAVTDTAGEAVLYLSNDPADSSANLYSPAKDGGRREVCRTVTLDQFRRDQGLRSPDLIKMDVEGAELAALSGAEDIISSSTPLLLIEMEEKNLKAAGASKAAIQKLLTGYGYLAVFLHKGRWRLTRDVNEVKGRNIFWFNPALPVHREKAGRISIEEKY